MSDRKSTAEPVYMVRSHGSDCWEEMSGESLEMCQAQSGEYEVRKLYAEQPAPVAEDHRTISAAYRQLLEALGDADMSHTDALGVAAGKAAPVAVTDTRTQFEIEHDAEPGDEAAFRKWRQDRVDAAKKDPRTAMGV